MSRRALFLGAAGLVLGVVAELVAFGWRLRARYGNLEAVEYRRREA